MGGSDTWVGGGRYCWIVSEFKHNYLESRNAHPQYRIDWITIFHQWRSGGRNVSFLSFIPAELVHGMENRARDGLVLER
jgi:hypothetical protein